MNLQEALALRLHIMDVAERAGRRAYYYPFLDQTAVVTTDGATFGVIYFQGVYEDYGETIAWSRDEWEKANMIWLQEVFNPDGEWAHRTVVAMGPEPTRDRFRELTLSCGHILARDTPATLGTEMACWLCQDAGVGWVRGMEGEKQAAPSHAGGQS